MDRNQGAVDLSGLRQRVLSTMERFRLRTAQSAAPGIGVSAATLHRFLTNQTRSPSVATLILLARWSKYDLTRELVWQNDEFGFLDSDGDSVVRAAEAIAAIPGVPDGLRAAIVNLLAHAAEKEQS